MIIQQATPEMSVHLYKSISRQPQEGGLPTSERYAAKAAYIDLTPFLGDGSQVQLTKNVRDASGSFTVTFADRPNVSNVVTGLRLPEETLESIYGLVEPNDILEFRMWDGLGTRPDPLPIKMRGFVSEVSRARQMGSDGKPMRQVVLSGQDYGKILQATQLVYLMGYEGADSLLSGYAIFEKFGPDAEQNTMTGGEFISLFLKNVIDTQLDTLLPPKSPMPRTITPDVQAEGMINNCYINATGPVYNLLSQYLDIGLWNELYVEDREEGVFLVWRPNPYVDLMTGSPIQPLKVAPVVVTIPDNDIVSLRQARTDATVNNFFFCTNTQFDMIDDITRKVSQAAEGGQTDTFDYPNTARKYYGLRPMNMDTVMGPEGLANMNGGLDEEQQDSRTGEMKSWLATRRDIVKNSVKDNVVLERGTLLIKGGPTRPDGSAMKPGDYITVLDGKLTWHAYVVSMTDTFVPFRSYTTSLEFERGTGFAERVSVHSGNSPWLTDQAERQTNLNMEIKL